MSQIQPDGSFKCYRWLCCLLPRKSGRLMLEKRSRPQQLTTEHHFSTGRRRTKSAASFHSNSVLFTGSRQWHKEFAAGGVGRQPAGIAAPCNMKIRNRPRTSSQSFDLVRSHRYLSERCSGDLYYSSYGDMIKLIARYQIGMYCTHNCPTP